MRRPPPPILLRCPISTITSGPTSLSNRNFRRPEPRLPATLLDGIRAFEADELVTATFGVEFQRIYAEQKYKEWTRGFYRVTEEERSEMLSYI